MGKGICQVAQCQNNVKRSRYCEKHYTRYLKYGDPMFTKYRMEPWQRIQAIIADIDKRSPQECWEYQGALSAHNYGKRFGMWVHRVAYNYWHPTTGHITKPYEVRHQCDNPPCCNPHHLILGTRQDNINDMVARQRGPVGESRWNALLTENDIQAIRADSRTNPEIAADYGVHRRTISDVKRRKTWKHVA